MRSVIRNERRTALLLSAGTAVLAAVDLALGRSLVLSGLYVVAPALAGALVGPGVVVFVTAWAAGLALLVAVQTGIREMPGQGSAGAAIVLVGLFSALAAGRRLRRERAYVQLSRVAEVAQATIIRPIPDRLGGLGFATVYRSAADEAQVGGDAYAALLTPYGVRLLVGDVKGKGLEAVAIAADLLATFRESAAGEPTLGELARHLEAALRPQFGPEDFVTVLLAQFRGDELTLLSCGHPWPLLRRAGTVREVGIARSSRPLGLGVRPYEQTLRFAAGDELLVFTDGLIEARDRLGVYFDPAGVLEATPAEEVGPPVLARLTAALDAHVTGRLSDDLAAVLVRHSPDGAPPATPAPAAAAPTPAHAGPTPPPGTREPSPT